jgi:hypothetical protein
MKEMSQSDQEKQDDFDEIVVEDAASEPGGCLGLVAVAAVWVVAVIFDLSV